MAIVKDEQGKHDEALELCGKALAIDQKALGPEHPNVGDALNNMAVVKKVQGKYDEAWELHGKALAIREKVLGPEHPCVGDTLNSMANVKLKQGKYIESLELSAKAREAQGKYDEALELYGKALAIEQEFLGPKDPSVGVPLNNMARAEKKKEKSTGNNSHKIQ